MLDTETKKRIDDARDILVGKVPDPKSQVEQITIALVYKFMDDMDRASVEMGGKASFFSGEYKRYSWSKIFDPKIGGTEMLNLYSEALIKLNQNPNIPQLFRDIFKNAYLPYRDPETLKLFLKTISEFSYDHSERLGDAFEYLLSVLGSQGDAGQFRTPRHIIDFMVEITDPKKNETILDPACGTAGFLISSYKHIIKNNSKKKSGDELNTAEKKKLLSNFKGYDISPDMIRLSLVNMYLHGFVQPEIMEYDTLTSEDRWKEYADVILANPPFMSPKGGIKPHKKFSVQSNRSEVLFVDYIAEHLTPTGRAAVIVPEGIIFQSAGAYKQLRKMLVENYLFAVVSLPAGVFNPYSGVKTSVLLMDRNLCSKTDSVLFVKIENDGFGLGAQRREVTGSDLPNAVSVIKKWKNLIYTNKQDTEELNPFLESGFALIVKKDKLAEKDEYNLTGDRYKVTQRAQSTQSWPMVKLGDDEIFQIESGGTPDTKIAEYWNGSIHWATLVDLPQYDYISVIIDTHRKISDLGIKNSSAKIIPANSVIVSTRATIGRVGINKINLATNQGFKNIILKDKSRVNIIFLAYMVKRLTPKMEVLASGGTFKEISKTSFCSLQIPLPPMEVQREIVAEIEGYQKIIDGARQVVDNWKPDVQGYLDEELKKFHTESTEHTEKRKTSVNSVRPDSSGWPMVKLGDLCAIGSGGTPSKSNPDYWVGNIPWVSPKDMKFDYILDTEDHISERAVEESATRIVEKDVILCVVRSGILQHSLPIALTTRRVSHNQDIISIVPRNRDLNVTYIFYYLKCKSKEILSIGIKSGVTVQSFSSGFFKEYEIPLPPVEVQERIVAKIEAERKAVDGCRDLIKIYEEKIKRVIDRVWEG